MIVVWYMRLIRKGKETMEYTSVILHKDIIIDRIVTIHYFEFTKDYAFGGESHSFWEFLYVDKGTARVIAGDRQLCLKQGEMVFHKPDEFHDVAADGHIAPNLVVISFECRSKAMAFFKNRMVRIGDYEKNLLALILREAREAYSSPLHTTTLKKLEKKVCPLFGCEQLIKTYLEQMLIHLVRKESHYEKENPLSSVVREKTDEDLITRITGYLQENVRENLRFPIICQTLGISGTTLKDIFHRQVGTGIMAYFAMLKIEEAKRMIREGRGNFSEISESLGYSSLHYFSRHFRRLTDMTPSQYASSVKVRI